MQNDILLKDRIPSFTDAHTCFGRMAASYMKRFEKDTAMREGFPICTAFTFTVQELQYAGWAWRGGGGSQDVCQCNFWGDGGS